MVVSPDNLFHFKRDQERYNIKLDYFTRPPLYDETHIQSSTYLNDFFFLVLSRFFYWQGVAELVLVDDEAAAPIWPRPCLHLLYIPVLALP
jgi:hypothetical protein